ncbi:MAG: 30S ribosomal protein S2 [Planctomycetota bacterium]
MAIVTLQELIEAGVHFGHRCSRWNPKMQPFIYGKRNSIHIIDLKQTVRGLLRGANFLERLSASGGEVLFVGTKPQVKELVKAESVRCGMHYVSERWLGGTLTNHSTIRSRLARLEELEEIETSGRLTTFSKKEISAMRREKRKLLRNLDGIRRMTKLPQAMVIIDPRREESALKECGKMGIPAVCVIDTDADPTGVDIAIPANDDAYRSVHVILSKLVDAVRAGRTKHDVAHGIAKTGIPAPSAPAEPAEVAPAEEPAEASSNTPA